MTTYQLSTSELPRTNYRLCDVPASRPVSWLKDGWLDFRARPGLGLVYGSLAALVGLVLSYGMYSLGMLYMVPVLSAGFLLIAPVLVAGLYVDARQRQKPGKNQAKKTGRRLYLNMTSISGMGIILLLVFLNWIMLSNLLLAGVVDLSLPALEGSAGSLSLLYDNIAFLLVYIGLGAFLAALVFRMCVTSIPMLVDQDIDTFNALFLSWKASGENPATMIVWAFMIAALTLVGILTAFLGLILVVPILGYASWHAYRDLVQPARM